MGRLSCRKGFGYLVLLVSFIAGCILNSGPYDPWICKLTLRNVCPRYEVHGFVEKGYEEFKEQFEKQFKDGTSLGAQLSVWREGKLLVDLYGNYNEPGYDDTSLQVIYSSSKTLSPIVIALLKERGLLSYRDPVAKHWPEFSQNGKENITIAEVLRHEAGLDALDEGIPWRVYLDQDNPKDSLRKRIEVSKPVFPEGTKRAYHAITRGFILNEIVKSVDPQRRSLGKILNEEVSKPLNATCFIGITKEMIHRVFKLHELPIEYTVLKYLVPYFLGFGDPGVSKIIDLFMDENSYISRRVAFAKEDGHLVKLADPEVPEALYTESPSVNAVCNARSLGLILNMLANYGEVNGVRILKKETVESMLEITTPPILDGMININTTFTDGGYGLNIFSKYSSNKLKWFGWAGYGGSISQV
eukprot:TRINITY_DN2713_c0_g1_i2.p1 TRINITY_DN2713_c0_g1~~TRINITY_DN2713_c0_g1_i2.p1  ORF type:complete len:415 (-),score=74.65 TRINITY_DN2713_c0_g1_i2:194-1438(-)